MQKSSFVLLVLFMFAHNSWSQIGNKAVISKTLLELGSDSVSGVKIPDTYAPLLQGKPDLAFSFIREFLVNNPGNSAGINKAQKDDAKQIFETMFGENTEKDTALHLGSKCSITFVVNPLKGDKAPYTEIDTSIQQFSINNDDLKTDNDYMMDKKYILLVFVGHTAVKVKDLNVKQETSYFSQTLEDGLKFILSQAGQQKITFLEPEPILFVLLKKEKAHAPSTISFNVPYQKENKSASYNVEVGDPQHHISFSMPYSNKPQPIHYSIGGREYYDTVQTPDLPSRFADAYDSVKIKNHELNHFALSIGIAATNLSFKNFTLSGDTLNVKLDSAQKKKLSSSLTIGFEWFPWGRDIDRFSFKDLKAGHFFDRWWSRFGIYGALKLSSSPWDASFLGLTLSITKEISINAGCLWQYQPTDQTKVVSGATSVSSAQTAANSVYKGTFSWGITISPGQAIKAFSSNSSSSSK